MGLVIFALIVSIGFTSSEKILVKEYALDTVKYPAGDLGSSKAIQEFFKIVEENNMNLSLIISSKYENKDMSVVSSITTKFREKSLQESKSADFTQEQTRDFLKTATSENLAAEVVFVNEKTRNSWTNKLHGVSYTAAHKLLLNNTKLNNWDGLNYIGHYTFTTPDGAGGEEITKIIDGHLAVNIIRKKNLSNVEIKQIKDIIISNYYLYIARNVFLKVLVEILSEHFTGYLWQGVSTFEEPFAIPARKYLWFEIYGVDYLVYGK